MVHFSLTVCIYPKKILLFFYPGVFADVSTGHFLSLDPQFTGLGPEISWMLHKKLLASFKKMVRSIPKKKKKKNCRPDSCKLHFLCHISTRADLEKAECWNFTGSLITCNIQPTYQTLFQSPHVSSADVLILKRQLHQIQCNILEGIQPLSHFLCVTFYWYILLLQHIKKITLGSTILTMTSWYARNLKACATVWSTLIVSGREEEQQILRSSQKSFSFLFASFEC